MTSTELAKLMKSGVKLVIETPKPEPEKPEKPDAEDKALLKLVQNQEKLIAALDRKPEPIVNVHVKAPVVNVAPPNVTVEAPQPAKKWRFTHSYNNRGEITETIAERIT